MNRDALIVALTLVSLLSAERRCEGGNSYDCQKPTTQPAVWDDACPECIEQGSQPACIGGVYRTYQWTSCEPAGLGEVGYTGCDEQGAVIGTFEMCEANWNVDWVAFCAATTTACVVTCGSCIAAPTPVNCYACAECLAQQAAFGGLCWGCDLLEGCEPNGIQQDVMRNVFKEQYGEACQGEP